MKYPRTPHLPNSPGKTNDDKTIKSLAILNELLTITIKKDGSNVCLTKDNIFARSHNGPPKHSSFDLLKQIWAEKRIELGNYEIYGEWLYAKHSIKYENLDSYLQIFNIRKDSRWLSFGEVLKICDILNFKTVPIISTGKYTINELKDIAESTIVDGEEGIVVRVSRDFTDEEFEECIAKYVRANHVQTDEHWSNQKIEINASKKFTKELLESILDEDAPGYIIVDDQFVEKSRWLLHHELIFREPGQTETAWSVGYVKGATENQDCSPFEYEPDEIECSLVRPTEIKILSWIEVNE